MEDACCRKETPSIKRFNWISEFHSRKKDVWTFFYEIQILDLWSSEMILGRTEIEGKIKLGLLVL